MYFYRKKRGSKSSLQLLESYRDVCGRARNRVVVSLGSFDLPSELWGEVSDAVECRLYRQQELLKRSAAVNECVESIVGRIENEGRWQPLTDKAHTWRVCTDGDVSIAASARVDGVLADRVTHTRTTTLGAELVGLHAWKKLKMPALLTELGFSARQQAAACTSVLNRLVDPVSEYGLLQWLPTCSLEDLLAVELPSNDDQYYRISDKLFENQQAIEQHLRSAIALQFGFQRTLILYDLTNTHFEGLGAKNEKARRGVNKQKRNDCPQLVVAVCFDECGFVLFHKTFAGNTHDAVTLEDMVKELEKLAAKACDLPSSNKPIWIMDGGIATVDNIKFLEEHGYRYLVNQSRTSRTKYFDQFHELDKFTELQSRKDLKKSRVTVRRIADPNAGDGELLLCQSLQRRDKELAMISRAEDRLLGDLTKLKKRVSRRKLTDPEKIQRAIGNLNAIHRRAFKYYNVELCGNGASQRLTWQRTDEAYERQRELCGCYVLRTNTKDYSDDELWHLYICLTTAESGFRALKSDLGLRPVFHQKETRCDAHVLITILAYQLLRFITYSLSLKGDKRSWQTLRRVLQTHCYSTILLPTTSKALHQIRKPGLAEECHRHIYQSLGIDLRQLPRNRTVSLEEGATL
jgi:transposase